jgi:heptosyltransferase-2
MKHLLNRFNAPYLSGIVHYCTPTLFLAAALWVWRLGRRRRPEYGRQAPLSIIIFRLDAIGDVVLSSAMLRELRRLYPTARMTLVVSSTTRSLVEHCPYIDEVLDKPTGFYDLGSLIVDLKAMIDFSWRQLRGRRWDLALVPRWDIDLYFATLMSLYAGATRRVAFTERASAGKRRLNWGFDTLYTDVLPPGSPSKHEVDRGLDVVRYLGGQIEETDLELWLTPADEAWAARFWSDFGLTGSKVVFAFGIGASQSKKQWPAQAFGELIDILSSKVEFTPAVVYGSNEKDLAREIQAHTGARLLLLQRPSLREVAAFLSRCTLFIGNDSGPKHMAAAAGIPVVEISCHPVDGDPENALNPCRFGPFTSRAIVVQPDRAKKPCSRACSSREAHCITQVSPAQVADQAICLLYKYGALCVDK